MWKGCWFVFLLLPAATLHAQQVHVGVKAGVTVSGCSIQWAPAVTSPPTARLKTGYTAGLFVHIPAGKRFAIRPGVEYVRKGLWVKELMSNYYSNGDTYVTRYSVQFMYLDIPLNLLYALKHRDNKILVGGGPVIGFRLTHDPWYNIAKTDAGINLVAGYEWPIGASLNLNYMQGIKNVSAYKDQQRSLRNYYAGFTVGYWF